MKKTATGKKKVGNVDMFEDIYPFCAENESPFEISLCGISYCDGSYKIERKKSDTNVIEYIVSGNGRVNENKNAFNAGEGDVYFLKHGRDHLYFSDADNPWVKIWFNFKGEFADAVTRCYNLENCAHFHAPQLRDDFEEVIKMAKTETKTEEFFEKSAAIFLKIAQKLSKLKNEETNKKSQVAQLLKNKIDNSADINRPFEDILKELFCSKCHAIREFRKAYNITPYAYILNKKFETAKMLLTNTALPVGAIAEKLGFCYLQYFCVSFKKRFSVTPTDYRKNKTEK